MASTDIWKFSQAELIIALLKQAGVTEGRWSLAINWSWRAIPASFGADGPGNWKNQKVPGAVNAVTGVEVHRIPDTYKALVGDVIVDAAMMAAEPTEAWPDGGDPAVLA